MLPALPGHGSGADPFGVYSLIQQMCAEKARPYRVAMQNYLIVTLMQALLSGDQVPYGRPDVYDGVSDADDEATFSRRVLLNACRAVSRICALDSQTVREIRDGQVALERRRGHKNLFLRRFDAVLDLLQRIQGQCALYERAARGGEPGPPSPRRALAELGRLYRHYDAFTHNYHLYVIVRGQASLEGPPPGLDAVLRGPLR